MLNPSSSSILSERLSFRELSRIAVVERPPKAGEGVKAIVG